MFPCKIHDLLLGHLSFSVQLTNLLLPRCLVDEGLDEAVGTEIVALQHVVVVQLGVADDRRQQVVGEFSALQFFYFFEQQGLHFVEALAFLRRTGHQEARIVAHRLHAAPSVEHLHLLVDVQVDESGIAVAEHALDDLERVHLQRIAAVEAPSQPDGLGFKAVDGGVARRSDGLQGGELRLTDVGSGFPRAEILVDDGDDLVGIEVAGHADGHVVRTVPLVEVVLDVRDRRVLQMLLRTDGGLRAVGMGREEHLGHRLPQFALVLGDADVVFFVDGLQLGVETADDHVLEPFALDLCPVLHFVRGNILGVAGHVVRCVGVGALSTDGRHELVVLVRDEILRGNLRDAVDFVVFLAAKLRVADEPIFLVSTLDVVQIRLFGSRIGDAELVGSLEHQVFQIVSQARGLGRIVLRAGADGDVGLNTRFLRVHRQVDLQPVVERVDTRLHQVSVHGLVLVVLGLRRTEAQRKSYR